MSQDGESDEYWKVIDQRLRPGPRSAVLVILGIGGLILVGVGYERAIAWSRDAENGRLIEAIGVASGVLFTTALLFLTRRSVLVASDSLTEAREQRKKDLLPILVIEGFAELHRPLVGEGVVLGYGGGRWEYGVRVLNTGPGVALRFSCSWHFGEWSRTIWGKPLLLDPDEEPEPQLFEVSVLSPPSALPSGGHYDFKIIVNDPLYAYLSEVSTAGASIRRLELGTLTVAYEDVYGEIGSVESQIELRRTEEAYIVECQQLDFRLPGLPRSGP